MNEVQSATAQELARRASVLALEDAINACDDKLSPDDFPVIHHFAPGQYAREMLIPAGRVIVGKIHKHAHVNVLSLGRCLVFTEHTGVQEIRAPYTFVSEAGAKRAVLTLEPVVWTTVHSTDKTNLADIEAEVIATNWKELA